MLDKFTAWERMPEKKGPEKWYFKTSFLLTAFLCVGPFALPFVWMNPRFSRQGKIVITVITAVLCYYLGIFLLNALKSIGCYYQQVNQMAL